MKKFIAIAVIIIVVIAIIVMRNLNLFRQETVDVNQEINEQIIEQFDMGERHNRMDRK
ncbi:MAG: hypothetical protein FWC79_05370 [Oscillospiraceae bacterium]|nr:hypothetical protein [Oscillospiraceae bacterium]